MDAKTCMEKLKLVGVLSFATLSKKGYVITDSCIGCGNCYENCPVNAVQKRGGK